MADQNTTTIDTITTTIDTPVVSVSLGVITSLLTLITVLGNILTHWTIRHSRTSTRINFKLNQVVLMHALSGINLFIGLTHMSFVSLACFQGRWLDMPQNLTRLHPQQIKNNNPWCQISSYILLPSIKLSSAIIVILSIERFIAIKFPFHYRLLTLKYLKLSLLISCAIVLAITSFEMSRAQVSVYMTAAYQCLPSYDSSDDLLIMNYINLTYHTTGILTVLGVNTYTFVRVRSLNRFSRTQRQLRDPHSTRQAAVTYLFLLLTTIDTVTWIPVYLLSVIRHVSPGLLVEWGLDVGRLRNIAWWVVYLSPAFNPILYFFRLRFVRKEMKKQVRDSFSSLRRLSRLSSSLRRDSALSEGGSGIRRTSTRDSLSTFSSLANIRRSATQCVSERRNSTLQDPRFRLNDLDVCELH